MSCERLYAWEAFRMLDVADFREKKCELFGYPDVNIGERKIAQINAQK